MIFLLKPTIPNELCYTKVYSNLKFKEKNLTMLKYRVGLPFWRTLARMGATLAVHVEIIYDDEASVFVATSTNLRGLVVEASDVKELLHELQTSIDELLYEELNRKVNTQTKISGFAIS